MKKVSRTSLAIDWLVNHPDETIHEVAKKFKLDPSGLYRAVKRYEGIPRCPTCGQVWYDKLREMHKCKR